MSLFSWLFGASGPQAQPIDVPSVEVHHIETNPDRRARCLKHLIKANHANYSIVYHNLQYDNHNPHVLSSAYLLGANEKQLHEIYDEQIQELEPWKPSPAEVVEEDWREYLGDRRYQRAYVDFFDDNLAMKFGYSWNKEVDYYLFTGENPLFHGLIGGRMKMKPRIKLSSVADSDIVGHPLIHLGYAFEMDCKELAMEGLGLACVQYNFFHKYLDNKSYTRPSPFTSGSPLELLIKATSDKRFDKLPQEPGLDDLEDIFAEHEELIMDYWNAWEITDPLKQFQLSQEAAVALFVATVRPETHAYNFFLVHLLTTSHAVRILLPFFPPEHHIPLVREWWMLVLAVFIVQGRPKPNSDNISQDLQGKGWRYVENEALNSSWSKDAHYVKAIRAMREAARVWGDDDKRYLGAAVTFVDNFLGWTF